MGASSERDYPDDDDDDDDDDDEFIYGPTPKDMPNLVLYVAGGPTPPLNI